VAAWPDAVPPRWPGQTTASLLQSGLREAYAVGFEPLDRQPEHGAGSVALGEYPWRAANRGPESIEPTRLVETASASAPISAISETGPPRG